MYCGVLCWPYWKLRVPNNMPWTETATTFSMQTAHHPTLLPDLASSCCCSFLLLCWQRMYCTLKAFLFSIFHGRMHFCRSMVFILLFSLACVWWMIKLCKCNVVCSGFDRKLQFACKNCFYFCGFNYICDDKRASCQMSLNLLCRTKANGKLCMYLKNKK